MRREEILKRQKNKEADRVTLHNFHFPRKDKFVMAGKNLMKIFLL